MKLEEQEIHPRLAERIVANAYIGLSIDYGFNMLGNGADEKGMMSLDDITLKHYLSCSTDCLIYASQMPGLLSAFRERIKKEVSDED